MNFSRETSFKSSKQQNMQFKKAAEEDNVITTVPSLALLINQDLGTVQINVLY